MPALKLKPEVHERCMSQLEFRVKMFVPKLPKVVRKWVDIDDLRQEGFLLLVQLLQRPREYYQQHRGSFVTYYSHALDLRFKHIYLEYFNYAKRSMSVPIVELDDPDVGDVAGATDGQIRHAELRIELGTLRESIEDLDARRVLDYVLDIPSGSPDAAATLTDLSGELGLSLYKLHIAAETIRKAVKIA
jgi:hypothetical protein